MIIKVATNASTYTTHETMYPRVVLRLLKENLPGNRS
jgi:hypothetical protein